MSIRKSKHEIQLSGPIKRVSSGNLKGKDAESLTALRSLIDPVYLDAKETKAAELHHAIGI